MLIGTVGIGMARAVRLLKCLWYGVRGPSNDDTDKSRGASEEWPDHRSRGEI